MKSISSLILSFLFVFGLCFGQEKGDYQSCATPKKSEEDIILEKHYGNNDYLLEVLKEHGFELPEDYFDNIDEDGLYKGKPLHLDKVKGIPVSSGGRGTAATYYIPMRLWAYRTVAGVQSIDRLQVDAVLDEMSRLFRDNGVPVEFYSPDQLSVVTSNAYFNIANDAEAMLMFADNRAINRVNVHFVNDAPDWGMAFSPTNDLYVLTNTQIGRIGNTLAHELGHILGLDHPFRGRYWQTPNPCINDNGECNACNQESVSRTRSSPVYCELVNPFNIGKKKCSLNGDRLCDTPGSPSVEENHGLAPGCNYNGGGQDHWGANWHPMVTNVMESSDFNCAVQFTYGQIGVMLNNIPGFATTNINYSISGPVNVCPGQSYIFSVPPSAATNFSWQVPENWGLGSNGNRLVTITAPNDNLGNTIYVTPYLGQKPAKLTVNVIPLDLTIVGPSEIADDGIPFVFSTVNNFGATNYNWSVWPAWFISGSSNMSSASIGANPGAQSGYINVGATQCGNPVSASKYVTIGDGGIIHLTTDEENTPGIVMFPNPAEDQLVIKSNFQEAESLKIILFEISSGKKIRNFTVTKGENLIDISFLASGTYLIKTDDNQFSQILIIK